jgi:tetratricopeptide (TPR) repeat protein
MLKNLLKNFIKFLLFSCAFFSSFFPHLSFAQEYVATSDIVKEIEKTLIFDDESSQKINIYQKKKSPKSSVFIDHDNSSDVTNAAENPNMKLTVTDPKIQNIGIIEKEKLAYNSVLIEQYEVAIELYKNVLKEEPKNVYAKFSLAVVYQKLGQFSQAKKLYTELLKDNPTNRQEIVENLLMIMVEETPRDAVYLLLRLSTQNPQSSRIAAQTAMAYEKIKNYDRAIDFLIKAVALDPDRLDYKYNLAVIYDKTAQYGKALEAYSDVAKNYSENNQFIQIGQVQKRIELLRNK